jgi:hypothetical protein
MNENDKILINAYLDGETSPDDSKYIESLLKSNQDANEYANKIKRANNEISAFFNSDESKELDKSISNFIEKQTLKHSKPKFQFDFFNNYKLVGSTVALALAGILIFPSFIEENTIIININSERGAYLNEGSLDIDKILSKSLMQMIDDNVARAEVIIGNEKILITVDEKKPDNCISGEFLFEGKQKLFISCLVDGVYETKNN